MKQPIIKKLEKKYFNEGGYDVEIPIPQETGDYGNPLFSFELFPGKKTKDGYYIEKIIVGIPHLVKIGYTAQRQIICRMKAIDLGESIREEGSWFHTQFCDVHKVPVIEIYPPRGAKYLKITNLYTSVGGDVEWQ